MANDLFIRLIAMISAARYATQLAIWIFVILILMVLTTISKSHAHDWYSGQANPVSGLRCCGGEDCQPVPLDSGWVQPVKEGYRVLLSLEEAKLINPQSQTGIDTVVPWDRVMTPPKGAGLNRSDDEPGHSHPYAMYHICIFASRVVCLFAVPST